MRPTVGQLTALCGSQASRVVLAGTTLEDDTGGFGQPLDVDAEHTTSRSAPFICCYLPDASGWS
jgi:hypothetical protein